MVEVAVFARQESRLVACLKCRLLCLLLGRSATKRNSLWMRNAFWKSSPLRSSSRSPKLSQKNAPRLSL